MAFVPPDLVIANALSAGLLGYTLGTNIFTGPIRPDELTGIPTASIFCLSSGGPEPMDYLQGGAHSPQLVTYGVEVYIRSNANEYAAGQSLARTCLGLLHDNPAGGGYYAQRVVYADPLYLGADEKGSHLFSLLVRMLLDS
jgi:hypothetical protein